MQNSLRLEGLSHFKIFGLFGRKNVFIPFDNTANIFIGENGLGKTTILNALFYTLTCKFSKLNSIIFDRIELQFIGNEPIIINREDIIFSEEEETLKLRHESRIADIISNSLSVSQKEEITKSLREDDISGKRVISQILNDIGHKIPYPTSMIRRTIYIMFSGRSGKLEEIRSKITKQLKGAEILYLPTYRRIEEELHKLGANEDLKLPHDDRRLIQFGMEDVNSTFNKIIQRIKNSSILGFSAITGEMLSQYLKGTPELDLNIKMKINTSVLKIVLERVGTNITRENKERILELVSSNEIFSNPNYTYLVNFLSKLVKIYDLQKHTDDSIKSFEEICNGYLEGKKVVYNESKVTINIVQDRKLIDNLDTSNTVYEELLFIEDKNLLSEPAVFYSENSKEDSIELKNLSSGEKQIISLFSRIYLDSASEIIVLFDEPELSLSLEWQKKLLPDILRSNKCSLLLSVTHSPFIFDNELDSFARDMNKHVSYI